MQSPLIDSLAKLPLCLLDALVSLDLNLILPHATQSCCKQMGHQDTGKTSPAA
jgi:hypothetical protein